LIFFLSSLKKFKDLANTYFVIVTVMTVESRIFPLIELLLGRGWCDRIIHKIVVVVVELMVVERLLRLILVHRWMRLIPMLMMLSELLLLALMKLVLMMMLLLLVIMIKRWAQRWTQLATRR
jgi:hypothetical protein